MQYVLGFCFNEEKDRVLLINKKRPDWQRGMYNGVGGKVEVGESALQAMIREFKEETDIELHDWNHFLTMTGTNVVVDVYRSTHDITLARQVTDEELTTAYIHSLECYSVIPNLRWMIPMALDPNHVKGIAILNH